MFCISNKNKIVPQLIRLAWSDNKCSVVYMEYKEGLVRKEEIKVELHLFTTSLFDTIALRNLSSCYEHRIA